jgi:formamidase
MRLRVDASRPLAEEPASGHNRWHPDIAPLATVRPGERITVETRDGFDGQLTPASRHEETTAMSLGRAHPLTGPIFVEGAEPGDALEVELLAYEADAVGMSACIPGLGFLADAFPDPYIVAWELDSGFARTPALPGIAIPAGIFAGVLGVAPSHELMEAMRRREAELAARGASVADPHPEDAIPADAANGLRTVPPRETGGNVDVRDLVAGSRVLLPVSVPGALLSVGDLHFAQGDGEACGTAIEMAGAVTLRVKLGQRPAAALRSPMYETPGRAARRCFATTGTAVTDDGRNRDMDLTLAARNALLALVDRLVAAFGFEREAAYVLASVAADLHLSQVVNPPNPIVSARLPLDVFDEPSRLWNGPPRP